MTPQASDTSDNFSPKLNHPQQKETMNNNVYNVLSFVKHKAFRNMKDKLKKQCKLTAAMKVRSDQIF